MSGSEPAYRRTVGGPVGRWWIMIVGDGAGEHGSSVNGLDLSATRADHQPLRLCTRHNLVDTTSDCMSNEGKERAGTVLTSSRGGG